MPPARDNLFDPDLWRPALDKYAAVTRLMVHVYDADGQLAEPWAAANPLAALFKEQGYEPGLLAACARRCLDSRRPKPTVLEGEYGLAAVGTPLALDGDLVGAAVAGYVLVDFTQAYRMRRLADESGVSFEHLWAIARLLPPVPKDRLMLHGELLQALGDALLRENRRTRASQQNVAELEIESAAKDQFLAVLSHELRNPLAALSSALEVLEMTDDAKMAVKSRGAMRRQMERLTRLVDDLLQVSRITRGKLQLKKSRVELAAVVHGAVEDALDFVDESEHELLVSLPEAPVYLEADAVRLGQVFTNLLNNAAKYTPRGGRIELSAERSEDGVALAIRDNGLGIPADKLGTLFEMFAQLDQPAERGYRGLGIGLSLAKSLVEMHGGTIAASSDGPGKGSTFHVWLPTARGNVGHVSASGAAAASAAPDREAASREDNEPAAAPARKATGYRVLVVDDNQDVAHTLGTLLEILGHEIRVAHDGREALDAGAEMRPELVLLDIGLPKLDGYAVARRIRAQSWGENVMLAAVTGWGQERDRDRAKEAGFDRHLTKPVTLDLLEALLESVARPRNRSDQAARLVLGPRKGPARTEERRENGADQGPTDRADL